MACCRMAEVVYKPSKTTASSFTNLTHCLRSARPGATNTDVGVLPWLIIVYLDVQCIYHVGVVLVVCLLAIVLDPLLNCGVVPPVHLERGSLSVKTL